MGTDGKLASNKKRNIMLIYYFNYSVVIVITGKWLTATAFM